MVLIYGEARGHSKLARQIYGERFPQRILSNARTFVNVVQHFRDFRRFEMNKRDLGRQREDRILVAEGEILHEIDSIFNTIPPPPGGTAILPEYIHYYGYYYQVIVQCLST
jgi:hypothetical protein